MESLAHCLPPPTTISEAQLWRLSTFMQQAVFQLHKEDAADPFAKLSLAVLNAQVKAVRQADVLLTAEHRLFSGDAVPGALPCFPGSMSDGDLSALHARLKAAATNLSFSLHARTTGASRQTHNRSTLYLHNQHYDDDEWVQRCAVAFYTLRAISLHEVGPSLARLLDQPTLLSIIAAAGGFVVQHGRLLRATDAAKGMAIDPWRGTLVDGSLSLTGPLPLTASPHHHGIPPRVLSTFNYFDQNRSGHLDVRELRAALGHYGIALDGAQVAELMMRYDDRPDGRLDVSEFATLIRNVEAGAVRSAPPGPRGHARQRPSPQHSPYRARPPHSPPPHSPPFSPPHSPPPSPPHSPHHHSPHHSPHHAAPHSPYQAAPHSSPYHVSPHSSAYHAAHAPPNGAAGAASFMQAVLTTDGAPPEHVPGPSSGETMTQLATLMAQQATEMKRAVASRARHAAELPKKEALARQVVAGLEGLLPLIDMHILRVGFGGQFWDDSAYATEDLQVAHMQVEATRDRVVRAMALRERMCVVQ